MHPDTSPEHFMSWQASLTTCQVGPGEPCWEVSAYGTAVDQSGPLQGEGPDLRPLVLDIVATASTQGLRVLRAAVMPQRASEEVRNYRRMMAEVVSEDISEYGCCLRDLALIGKSVRYVGLGMAKISTPGSPGVALVSVVTPMGSRSRAPYWPDARWRASWARCPVAYVGGLTPLSSGPGTAQTAPGPTYVRRGTHAMTKNQNEDLYDHAPTQTPVCFRTFSGKATFSYVAPASDVRNVFDFYQSWDDAIAAQTMDPEGYCWDLWRVDDNVISQQTPAKQGYGPDPRALARTIAAVIREQGAILNRVLLNPGSCRVVFDASSRTPDATAVVLTEELMRSGLEVTVSDSGYRIIRAALPEANYHATIHVQEP